LLQEVQSGDSDEGDDQPDCAMDGAPARDGHDGAAEHQQREEVEEGCVHISGRFLLSREASQGAGRGPGGPPSSAHAMELSEGTESLASVLRWPGSLLEHLAIPDRALAGVAGELEILRQL